jgi:hypothetical protein
LFRGPPNVRIIRIHHHLRRAQVCKILPGSTLCHPAPATRGCFVPLRHHRLRLRLSVRVKKQLKSRLTRRLCDRVIAVTIEHDRWGLSNELRDEIFVRRCRCYFVIICSICSIRRRGSSSSSSSSSSMMFLMRGRRRVVHGHVFPVV